MWRITAVPNKGLSRRNPGGRAGPASARSPRSDVSNSGANEIFGSSATILRQLNSYGSQNQEEETPELVTTLSDELLIIIMGKVRPVSEGGIS